MAKNFDQKRKIELHPRPAALLHSQSLIFCPIFACRISAQWSSTFVWHLWAFLILIFSLLSVFQSFHLKACVYFDLNIYSKRGIRTNTIDMQTLIVFQAPFSYENKFVLHSCFSLTAERKKPLRDAVRPFSDESTIVKLCKENYPLTLLEYDHCLHFMSNLEEIANEARFGANKTKIFEFQ